MVLARRALMGPCDAPSSCPGELLLWAPEWDNFDGHLEAESGGFFDVNDSPPWETWVGWFTHPLDPTEWYGLAWIPDRFVEPVTQALEVETTEVVKWAKELRTSHRLTWPFLDLKLPPDLASG